MTDVARLFPDAVTALLEPVEAVRGEVFPEERALVADAVPVRVREFLAGRILARRVLARLGVEAGALLRRDDRAPAWPAGVVGSVTHSRGWCGAAVARREALAGVGLDVEETAPAPEVDWSTILTPREARPADRSAPPAALWNLLHFSAKESVYKCLQDRHPGWIDFRDVELSFTLDGERFRARHVAAPDALAASVARIEGRCAWNDELVVTSAVLPAG